ncbi:MAG: HDIG domain-containing protein [Spirochaetaceae bacterium]|jgi:putative nucleotidyltransferase with HDIG domain|nr:HDIG domain-containing protein [Spirochaetaceae bacterium]
MPKKTEFPPAALFKSLKLKELRRGPVIATLAAFIITSAVVLFTGGKESFSLDEFEAGKVADRDVVATESASFIDEEATRIRMEARIKLVPAVFKYSLPQNDKFRKTFDRFMLFSRTRFSEESSRENFILQANAEFPGLLSETALTALFQDPDRDASLEEGRAMLEFFIEAGIFELPREGPADYNSETAELLHNYGERVEREWINYDRVITREGLGASIARYIEDKKLSPAFAAGAGSIVRSILRENVFFSAADTEQRTEEVRSQVEPVYRYIERGDRIIRKGFIITAGEVEELRALNFSLEQRDPRLIAGKILILLLIYLLLVFHMGGRIAGRQLSSAECYMMTILAAAYLAGAALVKDFVHFTEYFPLSILLPTALVVMLPAILIGFPIALVTAMILPLGAFLSESFDASAYIFALCSGVAAARALQGAQKRMDLVRAGLFIAAANAGAVLIVLLLRQAPLEGYVPIIFWGAFNGLASGLFVVGILPVIEQAMNAVTPFRLIELSDLNSPVLKRLFNTAPGTYSHSIMVANLAETACQEIGANALLARVGAYYHDIGKMEQPSYFVENQTSYNKHKDISPRLSATVIRSHVKLGIEKARSLGLPEAVIAFIAEHHGNSVITWFYNEALKREGTVNMEDFTYPGNPPRSKESAVVMLADVTEAATRTLQKPTVARLEKFIQELFDSKVEHNQLSQSDLTFRELETIKHAFVKTLAGHYHSRIEYPKLPAEGKTKPEGDSKSKKPEADEDLADNAGEQG